MPRYSGLRLKRYEPSLTIALDGLYGFTLVPARLSASRPEMPMPAPRSESTAPIAIAKGRPGTESGQSCCRPRAASSAMSITRGGGKTTPARSVRSFMSRGRGGKFRPRFLDGQVHRRGEEAKRDVGEPHPVVVAARLEGLAA